MFFIYLHRLVYILGVILSLEGSGICFWVLVAKQFCNDLLLINALGWSFRSSCIILRRARLSP